MANIVVIFPAGKQAAANAYKAFTDANWPGAPGQFAYVRVDAFGQWVVPYLGPPFEMGGDVVPEPPGGPAARADGILAETWTQPVEPEAPEEPE